ncbi:transposase [Mesorhizobium sp. A623]
MRMWISAEAIEGWRPSCRNTPGGQRRFSNLAIETTLMLGVLARFPLRQTEGFVRSLMALMNLDLTVPDHTTREAPVRARPLIKLQSH